MRPSSFTKRVFYGISSILWMLFLLNACVKDDITNISDNIMMEQSFAIPIGTKELRIPKPPITDTSSTGPNGIYYYDNLPFPITSPAFTFAEELDFSLSTKINNNWIKKLTFNLQTENSYLTHADLEIYLIDGYGHVLDSFFKGYTLSTGPVNEKRDTIVYESARLELLKQIKILKYNVSIPINSIGFGLTDENKLKVSIGATAELEYNVKDLN